MTLLMPFFVQCNRAPDKVAIIDQFGRKITYDELRNESQYLACSWAGQGIKKGMKVLVTIRPSIDFYISMLALWRLGAAAIFPEPFTGIDGLRHAAEQLRPNAILSDGLIKVLLPFVGVRKAEINLSPKDRVERLRVNEDDAKEIALYSFTGGTTGDPKCIARSHEFMLAQNSALSELLASEDDVDLVWFPVFVFACLAAGSTVVLPDTSISRPMSVDTEALRAQVNRYGVTRLLAPPKVAVGLARKRIRFDTIFTGGGPVFHQNLFELTAASTKTFVIYGSTEAEPISYLDADDVMIEDVLSMRNGGGVLVGKPVKEADVRILNDEILVAGPHVVESYLMGKTEGVKTVIDGKVFHKTGDGGRIDAGGKLWLRGRTIGRIGNYWPFELEAVARDIKGVEDAVLGSREGEPVICVVGKCNTSEVQERMKYFGVERVLRISEVPLDRRHASRTDYKELRRILDT